jgi:hypothetical protein
VSVADAEARTVDPELQGGTVGNLKIIDGLRSINADRIPGVDANLEAPRIPHQFGVAAPDRGEVRRKLDMAVRIAANQDTLFVVREFLDLPLQRSGLVTNDHLDHGVLYYSLAV